MIEWSPEIVRCRHELPEVVSPSNLLPPISLNSCRKSKCHQTKAFAEAILVDRDRLGGVIFNS